MNQITAQSLKQRMAIERVALLDVREPDEREVFHIAESIFIPLGELEERIDELLYLQDKELIVYCRSGNRSAQACMFLELSGFSNTVNLTGGTIAYLAE